MAAYSLIATGEGGNGAVSRFLRWLEMIRGLHGWWTSASGSLVPMGGSARGWSEVRNIRHTAKGLDVLLLCGEFRPDDATLFREVVGAQLNDGSYPQHPNGIPDLWSTAYVMNLMIRASKGDGIERTLPRGTSKNQWAEQLETRLEGARAWLCSSRSSDGMWCVAGRDSLWVTQAVVAEVGGDLALHRPDVGRSLAEPLLAKALASNDAVAAWGLLLLWRALSEDAQRQAIDVARSIARAAEMTEDTLVVSSKCRLAWLEEDPLLIQYYIDASHGHESALTEWRGWARSPYERWCVGRAYEHLQHGRREPTPRPTSKAEAWLTVLYLVDEFRRQVEFGRGWENLWIDHHEHRDEKAVQIAFYSMVRPLAEIRNVNVSREVETGRGPVDFVFGNGVTIRVLLEFKLMESGRLVQGLEYQLPDYMRAHGADSAVFVCIGFEDGDKERFSRVVDLADKLQRSEPALFVRPEFVDARRRRGASKAPERQ
jgi:hypothetical protein